jgi:hypothetical protein
MAHSATTINENGIRWQYAVPRRVVDDDLGGNYFDRIHSDGLKRYLVKRLQQLGHKVTLEPIEAT